MHIQLTSDEQILDEGFRKQIITQINGTENVNRKKLQAATWEIWRDQVRKYVLERLAAQGFKEDTLKIMNQRAANVNLFKKVVSKKARSYSKGVDRSVPDDKEGTRDIDTVAGVLDLTGAMKRADRYRKAARNCLLFIYPIEVEDENDPGRTVWTLTAKVFFPHLYDVIPDAKDREKARCVILSPFTEEASYAAQPSLHGGDGRNIMSYANPIWRRDGIDQTIANSPRDSGARPSNKREYIWWTGKYHFTTDENGVVISSKSPQRNENPINRLPFVNITEEQDGEFWAVGGEDLVESTILVNLKLTDMESILHMQGWGQLVVEGEDLQSKDFALGPMQAMMMNTAKGATFATKASILQHDPHTDEHLKSVEVHVALALTTNNLSIKSVSTNLDASTQASAIAKMVDESENMDDISEDQEYYAKKEKEAFKISEAWLGTLRPVENCLPELKETKPLKVAELVTQYHNQEQVVSEQERLANLKIRKELGLDTLVDLIKRDNPQMTEEQAERKALSIMNERAQLELKLRAEAQANAPAPSGSDPAAPAQEGAAPVAGQAQPGAAQDVRKETLNGAQITSIVTLVQEVAAGRMPRDAALNTLQIAFAIDQATAERLLGDPSFKVKEEEPPTDGSEGKPPREAEPKDE